MRLLSYSQVSTYIGCPYRWHMFYVEGWKQRDSIVPLIFGGAVHEAIAKFLMGETEHPEVGSLSDITDANERFKHRAMAPAMLSSFEAYFNAQGFEPVFVEQYITKGGFCGKIDLIADRGKERIVVDWKTASREYASGQTELSEQLTAYAYLANVLTAIDSVMFVCLKKPDGKIYEYPSKRTIEQISGYLQKVNWARKQMDAGVKHRNPDFISYAGCKGCSFLAHCSMGEDPAMQHYQADF